MKTNDFNPNDTLDKVRFFVNEYVDEKNFIFVDSENNIIRKVNEPMYWCGDHKILFIRTKKKMKKDAKIEYIEYKKEKPKY